MYATGLRGDGSSNPGPVAAMDNITNDDGLFLDAADAVAVEALARIGEDAEVRVRLPRRLLAVARKEATRTP